MEKDDIEKKKLYISQATLNKDNSDNDIKVASSIYRIKNRESIDINNKEKENNISVKKIYNSEDNNINLNNEKQEKELEKYRKSKSQNSSRQNSKENNGKKNKIDQNNRYQYFDNEDLSENIDDFSLGNEPQEKPHIINYEQINEFNEKPNNNNNNKENLEQMLQSNDNKKNILRRSSINNIRLSYLQEDNNKSNEELKKNQKNKNDDISKNYLSSQKYAERTKLFIALFSIGIALSAVCILFCFFLQLYGNQDVYIILGSLSLLLIVLYILAIKFISDDRKLIFSIIKKREDPEKLYHSKSRKRLLLIIYFLIIVLNYHHVVMLVDTSFINNIKLSIRGKGYDINQWVELFSRKNYNEILETFEKVNIFFLIFSWLNQILLIFIIIYNIVLLFNYRFIKSLVQLLCILATQGGIFQIYLSLYCYRFRDVTSFEGIRLSWVTPGTMSNGFIAIFLGFFGFYVFYIEDKKKIFIFQLICFAQIILLMIFTGGLSAIGDKFYNYKQATCNSLFKFVSEDYLLKNKLNGCTSKYLFSSQTLNNMQCPKDRIMINWEKTEKYAKEDNINDTDYLINDIDFNTEKSNNVYYGCINQSCCLQIYFEIKNKFDFLLILGIFLICFFIFLLIFAFYISYKLKNNNLEEEIQEKINLLILWILTGFIYITVFSFIFSLPNASNQSVLNNIDNKEVSGYLSIIPKDLTKIDQNNLYKYTNDSFYSIKKNIINNFKYNIIFDYINNGDYEYELSYFEYILTSSDLDIIVNNNKLSQISYTDFKYDSFKNSTKKLIFKSKSNIINQIFDYLDFNPYHPLKNHLLINIKFNGIFSKNKNGNEIENKNNIISGYENIKITKENIEFNYNNNINLSLISLINKELDFSIMNKNELFYLKGNINNDEGNSLINIYNYDYNSEPIYSMKTDINGSFIIGPLYRLINENATYYLDIEISKIYGYKTDGKYIEDDNYCKYYDSIKINKFGFHSNKYYQLNNIYLAKKKEGSMNIIGKVVKYNKYDEGISDVYIKLFYDSQIKEINKEIENNQDITSSKLLDEICINKAVTNEKGEYSLNIKKNGQYMIIFTKGQYYFEKHIFTIENITSSDTLEIGTMQLIGLFNSGKIIIRLEWDNKPPDLDLFCRFQASKEHYCYIFFGNKECGETEYYIDNREPKEISSEIIEIKEFSEYIYFFYVRKYYDNSNGTTRNEFKKEGVEITPQINYTELNEKYDEDLNNIVARLLIYTNGFKIPALKISLPGYIKDENFKSEYIYWNAFCINGKEGINSLKIINELSQNEPSKNICLSYYE